MWMSLWAACRSQHKPTCVSLRADMPLPPSARLRVFIISWLHFTPACITLHTWHTISGPLTWPVRVNRLAVPSWQWLTSSSADLRCSHPEATKMSAVCLWRSQWSDRVWMKEISGFLESFDESRKFQSPTTPIKPPDSWHFNVIFLLWSASLCVTLLCYYLCVFSLSLSQTAILFQRHTHTFGLDCASSAGFGYSAQSGLVCHLFLSHLNGRCDNARLPMCVTAVDFAMVTLTDVWLQVTV